MCKDVLASLCIVLASILAGPALVAEDASGMVAVQASEGQRQELVYYIWDDGNGHWFPTAVGFAEAVAAHHIPVLDSEQASFRWVAVGLSGWQSDWKPADAIRPLGKEHTLPPQIKISQSAFVSEPMHPPGAHLALTLQFDAVQPVDWLILKPPAGPGRFPRHFLVESALLPDGPWLPVPSANFVFFPDPGTNEIWIPLRGLIAGALRILAPQSGEPSPGEVQVAEARVLGGQTPPFQAEGGTHEELAAWNNLWLTFGVAANEVHQRFDPFWETDRPLDGGMVCIGSCEWLYWGAQKLSWLQDPAHVVRLERFIQNNPVGDDGLVWAAPGSEKHLGHSIHYVNQSLYPMAVAYNYLMRRNPGFLKRKDPKSGVSILEKARRAMRFQLDALGGKSGMLTVPGAEYDGTATSKGDNYWDFWHFGYQSAYNNAFFYEALRRMADLEEALGNMARAEELRALRPRVKEAFNKTFWNDDTGRYAGWVDVNGTMHDYGFTFVNAMALAFDLAPRDRAESVLQWLDGERTVEGDDSTGADIYAFGFAPRATTRDARWGDPPVVNTWGGAFDLSPGANAAFGQQIQNGGSIFYVSYYDLHARQRTRGPEDAAKRFGMIATEFLKDHLRRDPSNDEGVSDIFGILREFPESGLVPLFFFDGILGADPVARGLRITPALPSHLTMARVNKVFFAGKVWNLVTDRDLDSPAIDGQTVALPSTGSWLLAPNGKVTPYE